ncbi:unnamed protein product [Echinostoma caproni]|uniref:Transcription factor GAMYB n=1 Tax=Echinostoma caproni TaxID=27848 RepID=A0A183BGK2_9TREM|nr:unnamed protein product [Echinostoma caproni]
MLGDLTVSEIGLSQPMEYKTDALLTPVSASTVVTDVDWSTLVSAPSLFPLDAPTKSVCTNSGFAMVEHVGFPHASSVSSGSAIATAAAAAAAIAAPHSPSFLPFHSLESDFHDLMDTADSNMGLSPLVINWTGDA